MGAALLPGGRHPKFGTHNRLLGLADGLYLEVIAPDPSAQISGPRWFGLDHAPTTPRWGNWICRSDDLDAARALTGPVVAMARGDLRWQITRWEVHHPQADQLRRICRVSDATVVFTTDQTPHFVAHFDTPNGPVVI